MTNTKIKSVFIILEALGRTLEKCSVENHKTKSGRIFEGTSEGTLWREALGKSFWEKLQTIPK